jgi:uroporphyrinogen-III synthase
MESVRVLSTKKLAVNQKQFLLNAGFSVLEADFIDIRFKTFLTNGINQNLIFTSQNAFKSFLANGESAKFKSRPVFCVGSKTKEIIEKQGYTVTACADYATGLAEMIVTKHGEEKFTFFTGNLRREVLPQALAKAGITFNEVEVYETVLSPHRVSAPLDGILFFSPSGVESYLKENSIGAATCFCIGTTTAEALRGITDNIVVANKQTIDNTIVQCVGYYTRTRKEDAKEHED